MDWRWRAVPEDFERRVRQKIEEISRSQEIKNIKRDFGNIARDVKKEFSSYQGNHTGQQQQRQQQESQQRYHVGPNQYGSSQKNHAPNPPAVSRYKTVSVSGILFTVFGSVGLGIFTLLLLVSSWFAVVTDLLGAPFAVIAAVFVLLLGVSGGMLGKGISLLKRTNRLKRYLKTVGSSQFCPIDMLVRDSGRDKNFVLRDLQKMIRKKVLPGAHIDDQKTCLMLTDEVYNQYLYVQQQAQQREKEKQKRQEELKKQQQEQAKQDEQLFAENPELAATIRQGREMIEQIRRSNDKIEGEEISAKMDQMETIAKKIFEQVQEHPEKLPDIRRLMNYYLPTTLKLLNAYEEFDSQPVQGENIRSAKQQIEATLDTINVAFENLLDKLFTDEVLDVSSDITVLETMLKQEGLTGSEFEPKQ
ncbi:MAG: 5-bromo-4-chloroindolyl phosphate hydrolysis family protein [Negativibacillus sp.]|nr:5-bromo-4-chloroindolyl phosphate hydrolysis family protein [Negativibacillus sp.]